MGDHHWHTESVHEPFDGQQTSLRRSTPNPLRFHNFHHNNIPYNNQIPPLRRGFHLVPPTPVHTVHAVHQTLANQSPTPRLPSLMACALRPGSCPGCERRVEPDTGSTDLENLLPMPMRTRRGSPRRGHRHHPSTHEQPHPETASTPPYPRQRHLHRRQPSTPMERRARRMVRLQPSTRSPQRPRRMDRMVQPHAPMLVPNPQRIHPMGRPIPSAHPMPPPPVSPLHNPLHRHRKYPPKPLRPSSPTSPMATRLAPPQKKSRRADTGP